MFDMVVDLNQRHSGTWQVVLNTAKAVDDILLGLPYLAQVRRSVNGNEGETSHSYAASGDTGGKNDSYNDLQSSDGQHFFHLEYMHF